MADKDDWKMEPVPPEEESADAARWADGLPQHRRTIDDWMALGLSEDEAKDAVMIFGDDDAVRASFPDQKGGGRLPEAVEVEVTVRESEPTWDDRASSYKPGRPAKGFLLLTPEMYDQALRAAVIRFRDRFPALPEKGSRDYAAALNRWNAVRDWVEAPLVERKQLAAKELESARMGDASDDVKKAIQDAGLDVENLPPIDTEWIYATQLTPENFADYAGKKD